MNHNSTEARLLRIETALVLLCQHLGLNPRTGDRLANDIHRQFDARTPVPRRDARKDGDA